MANAYEQEDLKYVTAPELRTWIQSGSHTGAGKVGVIDVRESDFVGGHIKGAYNFPAKKFLELISQVQEQLISDDINDVVFHCVRSNGRGPRITLQFLNAIKDFTTENQEHFAKVGVWVLKGGFVAWQEEFGKDNTLTEDFDEEKWANI
ncbi:CDC25-like phosphatase Ych1p [[Candida] anglica]|uniref:CDC25-like phosphatase Ych1p n=1 Tax=[Candida] anglica TaxID=148631 RepID=A0ABP0EAB9_9ASCO